MEPAALIAIAVTVVLGSLAVLFAVLGIALWCLGRTRLLGPIITFIPTLAMLGAACGSWGLGHLVAVSGGPEVHGHAWWAWLVGLPVGGVLGELLGLWLALQFRSGFGHASPHVGTMHRSQ